MSVRKDWGRKMHQVALEDSEAWVQQLEEEFGGQCVWTVTFPTARHGLRPAVRLEVSIPRMTGAQKYLWEGWETIGATEVAAVEAAMLRLVSKALLELSGDKWRAERQATFL